MKICCGIFRNFILSSLDFSISGSWIIKLWRNYVPTNEILGFASNSTSNLVLMPSTVKEFVILNTILGDYPLPWVRIRGSGNEVFTEPLIPPQLNNFLILLAQ
jgi:hypothetical protein